MIFFLLSKVNNNDGNDFIPDAIKKGSKIIISEKKLKDLKIKYYIFKQKILENYLLKFHLKFTIKNLRI